MQKKEYFIKFPNSYIQTNIKDKFGINRKFYIVYILISRFRSYEGYSWITVKKVADFYCNNAKKIYKGNSKLFKEIVDVLRYMSGHQMVDILTDLDSVLCDTCIELKIIPKNFDPSSQFTKISSSQLDMILHMGNAVSKENLLIVFLYMASYIGDQNGQDKSRPKAFFGSVSKMAQELSMSKTTVYKCLNCLTSPSGGNPPLFVKEDAGSFSHGMDSLMDGRAVPNIYVLNKDGYEKEIAGAIKELESAYGH